MKISQMSAQMIAEWLDSIGYNVTTARECTLPTRRVGDSENLITIVIDKGGSVGSIAIYKGKVTMSVGFEDKVSLSGLRKLFAKHKLTTRKFNSMTYVEYSVLLDRSTTDDLLDSIKAIEHLRRRYK